MPDPAQAAAPPGGAQQAPFGTTSATQPTPNRGYEAAALQKVALVIKQLEELIPMAGAATDTGKACLDALNKLVKLVPAGSVTPAAEKNNIEAMAMKNTQNNAQMEALKAQRMGGAQPGAGAPPMQPKVAA